MHATEVRLRRFARLLDALSLLGCVLLVAGGGFVWAHAWLSPTAVAPGIAPVPSALLQGWAQWANVGLYALTAAVQVYALLQVRQTFRAAAAGEWFSAASIRGFHHFAWAILVLIPLRIVQQSLRGMLLTYIDPDQPTSLHVTVGPELLSALFAALLILFVARILVVGHTIDSEAKAFL